MSFNKEAFTVGTVGTGVGLAAKTAALTGPAANLGGYAVAQSLGSAVGIAGPALSTGIAAVGGPIVVGVALAVGVGCVLGKIFGK
jgi:hypothetical protein